MLEVIENYSDDKETNLKVKRFFTPPGIFDGLVSILIQELKKNPMRPHLCERKARKAIMKQLVETFVTKVVNRVPRDFQEICDDLPLIYLHLPKSNLEKLQDVQKRDDILYKLYM